MREPSGIRYPFRISAKGSVGKAKAKEKVQSNLVSLIKSAKHERLIRKAVGTVGYTLLFRSGAGTHLKTAEGLIAEAIAEYEPRAVRVSVKALGASPGADHIGEVEITYTYRDTREVVQAKVRI